MSISKIITINTLSQILGKASVVFLGIISTIFLRRHLGRAFYGDYVLVISLATMLATLADFGSHLIAVREASQDEKRQSQIIGNVIVLRFLLVLLAVIFMFILAFSSFFGQNFTLALILSNLIIFSLVLKNSLVIIFHIRLELFYFSLMNFLVSFLTLLGIIFLIGFRAEKNISLFIFNLGLANFISLLPFLPLAFKEMAIKFKLSREIVKRVIVQTAPMGGILLLFTLYSKIDTVLLKLYQGSEAVGVYGLTYKIHENLNVLAAYLMNSLLPIFSQLAIKRKKQGKFKNLFQTTFDILFLSGGFLTLIIFLASPLIIKILTGEFFIKETVALRILIFATWISFLNHLMGYAIVALRQQIKSFFISAAALAFNLGANIVFIPLYSFKAAAVNTILTEALVFTLSLLVIRKKLNWLPRLRFLSQRIGEMIKKRGRVFELEGE